MKKAIFDLKTSGNAQDGIPNWIQLLPAGIFPVRGGSEILKNDAPKTIILEFEMEGKIPLDQNHSTDLAASEGRPSPAVGWIVEMQNRSGQVWGRVEWNSAGEKLMRDKAYRFISPVLQYDSITRRVDKILRAALTNTPDIQKMQSLHSGEGVWPSHNKGNQKMDKKKLAKLLGLSEESSEAEIEAKLKKVMSRTSTHSAAAKLAGLGEDSESDDIKTALEKKLKEVSLHSSAASQAQAELKAEVTSLRQKLSENEAKAFVAELGRRKIVSQKMAENLISLHSQNPDLAKNIADGLPDVPAGKEISIHGSIAPSGNLNVGDVDKEDVGKLRSILGLTDDDVKKYGARI